MQHPHDVGVRCQSDVMLMSSGCWVITMVSESCDTFLKVHLQNKISLHYRFGGLRIKTFENKIKKASF